MDLKQVPGGIVTVVFGIVIVALMVFLIVNQYSSYQAARSELAIEREGLALDQARVARLEKMKREQPDIEEKLRLVEARLPGQKEQGAFIEDIGGYCQRSGVYLTSVAFKDPVSRPDCTELPFVVKVNGSYSGITNFIAIMQKGWRVVRIDSVQMTRANDISRIYQGRVQAEINGATFTREQTTAAQNTGQAAEQMAAPGQ